MPLESSTLELTICTRSAAGPEDTAVNNVFIAEDHPRVLSKHLFAILFDSIEHIANAQRLVAVSYQVIENFADLPSFKRLSVKITDPTAKRFLLEASGLPAAEARVKLQIQ
ncbi:MAG TPA: hypothetical protein VM870_03325, partial [Pyrinomonadaceae bacterium]|nr:hypothetical protein [Pyrinomonadaceae bacterium]